MGKPKARHSPSTERKPRIAAEPTAADAKPVWRVGRLDFGGPWCPKQMASDDLFDVLARLRGFESMTWFDVEKSGSHFVAVEQLVPEAQQRLQELHLDDFEDLFSLRIGGKQRLWGLRDRTVFFALWWDPDHQVCPAPKKHT